jgi:YYY domain-containing protein
MRSPFSLATLDPVTPPNVPVPEDTPTGITEDERAPMLSLGPLRPGYRSLLLIVLILAAVLRFVGLDWDNGYYLHPDERFMVMVTTDTAWPESIGQYFDSETSPLNPYNTKHGTFVYGTFPLILTKAINTFLDRDVYGEAHLVGRVLSALSDIGTVALVAWIARHVFGRWAGILAGFFLACTMLHIQSAHFYTVDAMSVFFATATFAAALQAWRRQGFAWFAVAGLMTGLAGASKPNYLIAAAFLALPALEMIRLHGWHSLIPRFRSVPAGDDDETDGAYFPIIPASALAVLVAFWTFRLAQPYAFAGPDIWSIILDSRWVSDLDYWSTAQGGFIDVKSSIQWVDRTPLVYILDNMIRWGMGPPLAIAALAGLALAGIGILRSRHWPSWWVLGMAGWTAAQLLFYGLNLVQAQRYLLPIYPFLIVFAAGAIVRLAGWRWPRRLPRWAQPGTLLVAVTVIYTLFYAVAFDSLYVRPLSRVQASEWIFDNVPAGSAITSEYWDDSLPMRLEGEDAGQYTYVQLDLYAFEGPDSTKLSEIIGQINQADYIILSSNRVIESVPRQADRYPMATAYYEMLVSGELGFDLVADFSQNPELFGITLDDRNAEETLTVYEHPYVRIFQKTDRFDAHEAWYALDAALGYGGVTYLPGDPSGDQMLMSPDDRDAYAEHATWSDIFDRGRFTNTLPALWWYLAMQLLTIPAIPLAWWLLRGLPDRGYALARTLGLVGVTWIAWMLASYRILPFGGLSIGLAWTVVLLASLLATRGRIGTVLTDLRSRWRWVLATEMLFLAAFAGMTWIRSLNPDFWNTIRTGEASLFLGMFNATMRSPYFPAFDPWLSGGWLHVPYWGQMPWVAIGKLTGIVPNTAYNLAFAGIFALLCLNTWTAAAAIIARITSPRPWRPILLALAAPVAVALLGTLMLARRVGQGMWGYAPRPESWPELWGIGDIAYGVWTILTDQAGTAPGLYHEAMDVSPVLRAEMPFFSFLAGDLGPATTALPFIGLAIAVAVALATREGTGTSPQWRLDRADIALMLLGGGICGLMMATTTWGFLPTAILMIAAMAIRSGIAHAWHDAWPLLRNAVICAALILVTAVVAFWPFLKGFRANGRDVLHAPTLGLGDYLTLNGVLLFVLISYLALQGLRVVRDAHDEGWAGKLASWLTITIIVVALALGLLSGSTTIFVLVGLLLVAIALWPHQDNAGHLAVMALTGLGLLLAIVRNVLPMTADIDGRSSAPNLGTYAWIVLGIAAAAVVAWGIDRINWSRRPALSIAGTGWLVAIALLVVATATYPVLATTSFREDRMAKTDRTLDATAFMRQASFAGGNPPRQIALRGDLEATAWLMDNVDGVPVVLEAQTLDYQWGGRVSALTGLPTVIGWNTPERMMRSGWTQIVWDRQADVTTMLGSMGTFTSIEPLLRQYDVQLIYIGALERAMFDPVAIRKFETAAAEGQLEIVYQNEDVTIYRYPGWNQ